MTMTLSEVLAAYRADRETVVASLERLSSSISPLDRLLGGLEVASVGREESRRYLVARRSEGVCDQTVRRELITLRAALRLAWKDGRLAVVPPIQMPAPAPPRQRILSPDEAKRLRAAVADDPAMEVFVGLLFGTGARREAVLELTWDRVDFARREIDLRAPHEREARRKNRAVCPINSALLKLLRRHRKRTGAGDTDRVVGLTTSPAGRRFRSACERVGLVGVTPHTIRHTVATHLLRHVSLVQASRMLGHRSVAITEQVYGHLTAGDLKPAADALREWLG